MINYCEECHTAMERMYSCPKCNEAFCDQLEALQAQNRKLVEALEFYAEEANWYHDHIIPDAGNTAKQALSTLPTEVLQAWKLERDVVKAAINIGSSKHFVTLVLKAKEDPETYKDYETTYQELLALLTKAVRDLEAHREQGK